MAIGRVCVVCGRAYSPREIHRCGEQALRRFDREHELAMLGDDSDEMDERDYARRRSYSERLADGFAWLGAG